MQCPECGYMMSAFDKECPRCKDMKAKGVSSSRPTPLPGVRQKALPGTQEPVPVESRPLRVVSKEIKDARFDAQSPAPVEPAPLIIYTNRIIRWQPWAALAAVVAVIGGGYWAWQAHVNAVTQAIVQAARVGACQRMPGMDSDRDQQACTQLASALTYTVKRDADSHASVVFYLNGVSNSLEVSLNQDEQGDWHAVSAKEGDEGNRQSYDRSLVPTYEYRDPPPQDTIGGPTVPADSAPPPDATPPSALPESSSSTGMTPPPPAFVMKTQAGGGPPPNLEPFKPR